MAPGLPCRHAADTKSLSPAADLSNINHGLLLPTLLHYVDDQGRRLLGPASKGHDTAEFLRNDHRDIPAGAEAMRSGSDSIDPIGDDAGEVDGSQEVSGKFVVASCDMKSLSRQKQRSITLRPL